MSAPMNAGGPVPEVMMEELGRIFPPCPNRQWRLSPCDSRYAVSNDGHVVSFARKSTRVLKTRGPGQTVWVAKNVFTLNRLVLATFTGERQNFIALPKDGNPSNSHVDNLFWGTELDRSRLLGAPMQFRGGWLQHMYEKVTKKAREKAKPRDGELKESAPVCVKRSPPMIALIERRPVDWFRIIVDLEREGYTHTTLAQQLHPIHRATVGKWRCRTSEPAHANGEALIALWMAVTGRDRASLPRRRDVQLSAARVK